MSSLPRHHPTVVHMLQSAAVEAGDAEALVAGDVRLSYTEYRSCVARFAKELQLLQVAGERVAILMGNSADICIALFATHAAGAVAVPLNPLYTERELRLVLADARPSVLIHDDAVASLANGLGQELGILHIIATGPASRRLAVWSHEHVLLPEPLPAPDSLATLQYTGGTTGRSKGVRLTHAAIAINIAQREALLPTRSNIERLLCVMPLFHVYAIAMCLHNMVACRGCLIVLPRFQPKEVLDLIRDERVTIFAGSPTLFTGLMNHEAFANADFSSLHLSYSGSAALPEELFRRWESASGAPVVEGYGQSEAGPVVSFNPLDGMRKPGSVGIPLPGTDVQIVDLTTGDHVLPAGERGEIRVRGPQVMSGYHELPEETAAALRNGWLYTGDIGEFDADGYLYIRDRKKEMVKVSGFNVFPREVEEVLYAHPAVLEAAVIGVPDPYKGETVCAFVVLRRGATADFDSLIDYCRKNLARYKVPGRIEIVEELPKTRVGKFDKVKLRENALPR